MKPGDIERSFSAGECILDLDARVQELYVIRSGEVRVGPDERLLGPGDLVGEVAAITGRPSQVRAVAESDGVALTLSLELLQELCLKNGEFVLRLIRHLAEQLDGTDLEETAPVASAALAAVSVARAILARAEPDRSPALVDGRLRELAKEADLDLAATYHEVQALLEEKVVLLSEDQLQILDRAALESMSG